MLKGINKIEKIRVRDTMIKEVKDQIIESLSLQNEYESNTEIFTLGKSYWKWFIATSPIMYLCLVA